MTDSYKPSEGRPSPIRRVRPGRAAELMGERAVATNAGMAAMKHCHKQRGCGCKKYN